MSLTFVSTKCTRECGLTLAVCFVFVLFFHWSFHWAVVILKNSNIMTIKSKKKKKQV